MLAVHEMLAPAQKGDHPAPDQDVGGLGTVPAGVHAHRAADRARYPDRPLEPGEPGRGAAARQHRVGGCPAGAHEGALDLDAREAVREPHAQSCEPTVGDEQVRPLAEHDDIDGGGGDRARHAFELGDAARFAEQGGGAADTVGGQLTERPVALGQGAQHLGGPVDRGLHGVPGHAVHNLSARSRPAASSAARFVRSPAASVRHKSPGRRFSRR